MQDVLHLVGWNQLVAVLMGMAVWLACRTQILSRRPAVCHGLWLLVLLKLVTPPIVPVPVLPAIAAKAPSNAATLPSAVCSAGSACDCCARIGDDSETTTNQAGPIGIDSSAPAAVDATESPSRADVSRDTCRLTWRATFMALLGVSLFVSCALWIAAARQLDQMRRLLRGSAVKSGRAAELLREVSRLFNSRTAVNLQIVDAPITPMFWAGSGNPAIVLPRQLVDSLNDDALRSIIAHELGHFMRRDHWANLFALVVTTLFWWNPIVWIARRQLSAAAEACCDAVVLERLLGSRKSYAETLLTVVDSLTSTAPQRSAFGVTFGESHSLRRRFEMIADADVSARMTRSGWILLALGFATLMLVPARAEKNSMPAAISLQREPTARATRLPGLDDEGERPVEFCCPS